MLVLTRRADDGEHSAIKIGHDVEVTVIEVRGGQVRIGVSAPPDVTVHREEIWLENRLESLATESVNKR